MSQALKCDRCKICFDPWTATEEFTTLNDIVIQDRQAWANREVTYRDEEYHMCPECTKKFKRFMSGDSKEIEKDISDKPNPEKFRFKTTGDLGSNTDELLKKMRSIAVNLWREPPNCGGDFDGDSIQINNKED